MAHIVRTDWRKTTNWSCLFLALADLSVVGERGNREMEAKAEEQSGAYKLKGCQLNKESQRKVSLPVGHPEKQVQTEAECIKFHW